MLPKKSARIRNSYGRIWFTRGMHESYGVATVRNDITAPRRLATLSVGSMGKTPRLGSKIRAIDSYRSYGRPMRASSPLKNTRLARKKGSRLDFILATIYFKGFQH